MDIAAEKIRFPFPAPPAEGKTTEVAEGILWARLPLPMALDHVNVYAIDEGDSWCVIDTGFQSKRTKAIWQALLDGPLQGKPVGRVIVTHHHPDHVGLAGWFQRDLKAELWMPRTAWLMARMLTLDEHMTPTVESLDFYRAAGMDSETFATRATSRPFNFCDVVAPLPLGFRRLAEGDELQIGTRRWRVHMGDGHAPEHATLWSLDDHIVIAGDQVLPGISPNLGVYPTEPEADPVGEWLAACERFRSFARLDHLVLPGHKLPFTGLPERLTQLIDNHHGALDRLEEFLGKPATAVECFPTLFKRQIGPGEYGLALVEAYAHLNHLFQTGRAGRVRREDGAWVWHKGAKQPPA